MPDAAGSNAALLETRQPIDEQPLDLAALTILQQAGPIGINDIAQRFRQSSSTVPESSTG